MGWRLLGAMAMGVVSPLLLACGATEFTCEADVQCMGQGAGVCQPDGHCSFPAADCPSGQRYGEHSGPLSGQCVGEGGTESTGAAGSTSTTPPMSEGSGPGLDSGGPSSGGDATTGGDEATGPAVVTTGDDGGTGEASTGEPVDPDLVLWLALDRAPLGDVLDSSPYMGNGSCEAPGCPEGGRGLLGAGAWFDGLDDVILVPHAAQLETTEAFTIAAFVRIGDPPPEHRAVMTKPFGTMVDNTWEIYLQSQTLYLGMSSGGTYVDVTVPWEFAPEQWVHLAGTWDGGLLTLWIDGEAAGSVEASGIEFDDHPVHVGADDDHEETGLTGYFLGTIDDVRVYRRALTAEEIAALAVP